ncbi:uncharacterized protein LOC135074061 [Ostrinia nubilalis]|uniref:uncharacterized protein LOC135074061 n=1 Tax=Ostrinia nubilalis TaxID=29057 RepID=UPI0030823721
MLLKLVILNFLLFLTSLQFCESGNMPDDDSETDPLSITCMKCICKVMGCIKDEGCVNNVCGVMHITQGYWEAAHDKESDPANLEAFQKCSNNVWCATRTVQRFMKRRLPACEAKRPDRQRCENALALHKFGSSRCDRNLTANTERKFLGCLADKVWKWLEDDLTD